MSPAAYPGIPMKNVEELKKITSQVRRDIIRQTHGANSGHPGGSLGCAEFFVALYFIADIYKALLHKFHNLLTQQQSCDSVIESIMVILIVLALALRQSGLKIGK